MRPDRASLLLQYSKKTKIVQFICLCDVTQIFLKNWTNSEMFVKFFISDVLNFVNI